MKKCCVALLTLLPLTALAYPIEVNKTLGDGIKVDAQAFDTAHDLGAVTLTNYGDTAAQCKVSLRNGPEAPRVRRVDVAAKKTVDLSVRFNREILKLRVDVDCKAK